ncbi:hypothetical protein ACTOV4_00415 [Brucella sp. C7-11G]
MASKELIASVIEAIVKNPPKVTRFKDMETLEHSEVVDYTPTAKAAIATILAAIQEPTEEMREAGIEAIDDNWERGATRPAANSSLTCWRAMLNASALGEKSE